MCTTSKFVPDEPIPNLELRQSAVRNGLTRGKRRFFYWTWEQTGRLSVYQYGGRSANRFCPPELTRRGIPAWETMLLQAAPYAGFGSQPAKVHGYRLELVADIPCQDELGDRYFFHFWSRLRLRSYSNHFAPYNRQQIYDLLNLVYLHLKKNRNDAHTETTNFVGPELVFGALAYRGTKWSTGGLVPLFTSKANNG